MVGLAAVAWPVMVVVVEVLGAEGGEVGEVGVSWRVWVWILLRLFRLLVRGFGRLVSGWLGLCMVGCGFWLRRPLRPTTLIDEMDGVWAGMQRENRGFMTVRFWRSIRSTRLVVRCHADGTRTRRCAWATGLRRGCGTGVNGVVWVWMAGVEHVLLGRRVRRRGLWGFVGACRLVGLMRVGGRSG